MRRHQRSRSRSTISSSATTRRMTSALRVASRKALERCILEYHKTHGLLPAARDLLSPPAPAPEPMICAFLSGHSVVQLPPEEFGSLLTQGDKVRLQCVSRVWYDATRMPAMWRELSLRHASLGATHLLALLESRPVFSQIRAIALPRKMKIGPKTCDKIRELCPNIVAIDTTEVSPGSLPAICALGNVFGALRNLRINEYRFSAGHFAQVLGQCMSLQSLEARGPLDLALSLQHFPPQSIPGSPALEELSLDLDYWGKHIEAMSYETQISTRILTQFIVAKLPNLRTLCLSRWTKLTEEDVQDIVHGCRRLIELRLAGLRVVGSSHPVVTRIEDWRVSDFMSSRFPKNSVELR